MVKTSDYLLNDGKTLVYPLADDLSTSRLALGCMHFGGEWDDSPIAEADVDRARSAVETALELGWNFFDHADIYCRGKSERVFARILKDLGVNRESLVLQSKCGIRFAGDGGQGMPHRFDFSKRHIIQSTEAILKRLETDYLDILLLHRPDLLMEPEEIVDAFMTLRDKGQVREFGVSNHTPALMELMRSAGVDIVANQVELNALKTSLLDSSVVVQDRDPAPGHPGDGTLEYHRRLGIVTQAWAPLAYGYLSGREPNRDPDRVRQVAKLVSEIAYKYDAAEEAIVIGWLLRHPAAIQPVIGTRDPERLRRVNQALKINISREDWYKIYTAGRGKALP